MLNATIHYLTENDIVPECLEVRSLMRKKFTAEAVDKSIPPYDWSRWSIVLGWIRGTNSILDIGSAHGTFINSLACSKASKRLVAVDIRDYSLYSELFPGFSRIMIDAEKLPFENGEFDVVTCMEVIEHLPEGKMERVIKQLRRVAKRRLIVSVPFCEPLPLSKYHCQQFTPDRVKLLFPNARYTLMLKSPVTRVPWLVIVEEQGDVGKSNFIVDAKQFLRERLAHLKKWFGRSAIGRR